MGTYLGLREYVYWATGIKIHQDVTLPEVLCYIYIGRAWNS